MDAHNFPQKSVARAPRAAHTGSTTDNSWTCTVQVPAARGTHRVSCDTVNKSDDDRCAACGATKSSSDKAKSSSFDKSSFNHHTSQNRTKNMATPTKPTNPDKSKTNAAAPAPAAAPSKPAAAPTKAAAPVASASAPTSGSLPTTDSTGRELELGGKQPDKYKGLPRLRFYSTKAGHEDYCVRILPIFYDRDGAPKDPWGETMKLRPKQAKELGDPNYKPAKVARAEAKEAEAKLLASMSDEQKLAYAKQKREERQAAKAAKQAAQKAALMAELRKELEAQGVKLPS